MIFVTVGSMFAFDRLVRAMDELVATGRITEPVFAQIGSGTYSPMAIPFERFIDKARFDELMASADCIVSHAGIGSIASALEHGKPILVLPRLKRYGEVVSDHQVATAYRYSKRGYVLVAWDEQEIPAALERLDGFHPASRNANVDGIATRVGDFLRAVKSDRK